MSPRQMRQTAFRIEPELLEGLHAIKDRIGIPISVQVRRAIRDWIDAHGGMAKVERKWADTRKRS